MLTDEGVVLCFQQVAYFSQQYFFFAGRWCFGWSGFLFAVEAVDAFDKQEDGDGNDQEVEGGLQKVAIVECYGGDGLTGSVCGCFFQNEFEVGKINAANQKADWGHDDVRYDGADYFAKSAAHDNAYGHVNDIAAHGKCLEFIQYAHVFPFSVFGLNRDRPWSFYRARPVLSSWLAGKQCGKV